jgi:hypothetical protein
VLIWGVLHCENWWVKKTNVVGFQANLSFACHTARDRTRGKIEQMHVTVKLPLLVIKGINRLILEYQTLNCTFQLYFQHGNHSPYQILQLYAFQRASFPELTANNPFVQNKGFKRKIGI